mmetsp:Transcript_90177/g.229349  ORF Transcript_90177/g.229349 Transcript_90177/m.229349 type:complete len:206 (+) Transcript_90177:317-934(+)
MLSFASSLFSDNSRFRILRSRTTKHNRRPCPSWNLKKALALRMLSVTRAPICRNGCYWQSEARARCTEQPNSTSNDESQEVLAIVTFASKGHPVSVVFRPVIVAHDWGALVAETLAVLILNAEAIGFKNAKGHPKLFCDSSPASVLLSRGLGKQLREVDQLAGVDFPGKGLCGSSARAAVDGMVSLDASCGLICMGGNLVCHILS